MSTTGPVSESWLKELKDHAIQTNKEFSAKLGINPSAAITTVKPSGTVSQLVDSASGIHPRHSPFYIRTVRSDKKDPLALFMRKVGFKVEDDITKPEYTDIFSFPIKAPETSVYRNERSAVEQLEHYLTYKKYWCEHNPSITVYVSESEWLDVQAWVYRNWDSIGGVSFLPRDGGTYKQAPYQESSLEDYNKLMDAMPKNVDWSQFTEETDNTTSTQELNCQSGTCEIG
jgi:ribonucleoside-triphosphate reductase (thioredoxin)